MAMKDPDKNTATPKAGAAAQQKPATVTDAGRTLGSDEIKTPNAEERAGMSGREKAKSDNRRSIGEALPQGAKAKPYASPMIRSPEQNPPLGHPDYAPSEPLTDDEKEQALQAGPMPTGADMEPLRTDGELASRRLAQEQAEEGDEPVKVPEGVPLSTPAPLAEGSGDTVPSSGDRNQPGT